jgi:hypothetical protein
MIPIMSFAFSFYNRAKSMENKFKCEPIKRKGYEAHANFKEGLPFAFLVQNAMKVYLWLF